MSRVSPPQLSFSGGEITPLLHGRPDFQRYQTGVARCRGFVPLVQGPATRLPGSRWLGSTKSDGAARFIPFIFSDEDFYALEFGNLYMRVWRNYEIVESGPGTPFEIVTPFDLDDVAVLQWVRSKDVLYLCDGTNPPQQVSRFGHASWTIGPVPFENGPFRAENTDQSLTVKADGETGTVTLTASAALFTADHVGSLMQLRQVNQPIQAIQAGETFGSTGGRRAAGNRVYEIASTGDTNATPIHTEGTVSGGAGECDLTYIHDDRGIVEITAVASGTSATATVLRTLPTGVITGTIATVAYTEETYRWSEGAWSALHGYPRAIARHEQRILYAGTPSDPDTVQASATGSFIDFDPGTLDDSAFSYRVDVDNADLGVIEWLNSTGRRLTVGGFSAVAVSTTPKGEIFGPTTISFDLAESRGVRRVAPQAVDGAPVYVPRIGRSLQRVQYDFQSDRDQSADLTKAASHILGPAAVELAWQYAPWAVLWCRIEGGDLAALAIDTEEQVLGFSRFAIGGEVESLCVLPRDGGEQEVWMIVNRTIGGATRRFVEVMQQPFALFEDRDEADPADAWHVWAGARFEVGSPIGTFTGFNYLIGEEVVIWSPLGDFTATVDGSGNVTLADGVTVTSAIVGLAGPDPELRTLDIAAGARDGGSQGRDKRIRRVAVRLKDTVGGEVRTRTKRESGWTVGAWRPLLESAVPFAAPELFSGVVEVTPDSGWGQEVAVDLRPYPGAPMTVQSVTPMMKTSDD